MTKKTKPKLTAVEKEIRRHDRAIKALKVEIREIAQWHRERVSRPRAKLAAHRAILATLVKGNSHG